jgi:DNA segregation ATPase FtsK/SpoIIIE, S-DNA-T family
MSRRRGRRRSPFKLRLEKDTLYSLATLILVGAGAFVIVAFSREGPILDRVFRLLQTEFGWTMIFLPFLLIIAGLMLTKLRWKITQPAVFVGSSLVFAGILGLSRAGNLGEALWENVAIWITDAGAVIIFLGLAGVGYIIATETGIDEVLLAVARVWSSLRRAVAKFKQAAPGPDFIPLPAAETKPEMKIKDMKPTEAKPGQQLELGTQAVVNAPGMQQSVWEFPPLSLLEKRVGGEADRGDVKKHAATIEKSLESFGIQARVVEVNYGPAVTQYALEIALGTKLSKITALQNDLALALAAPTGQIRIEAPIPGRSLVGIEIPNRTPEFVPMRRMLQAEVMQKAKSKLTVALGLDVSGEPVIADIGKMPHVLIAGSTGSGKSICLNSFIATFLFRASPQEVKLILVDPKRVELTQYNGIPHLLTPVIVEPDKVVSALKWSINEMERRYKLFAEVGARNIEMFNDMSGFQALPYLIIIVDELADIMLFAPSEVEDAVTRIAQMARATGIHLVLSTQRPSVDVITGLIKANIPCRIAFNVSSMIDSRVIIDTPGAEKLLGRGDMLYIPPDQAKPTRIQGTFVSEPEIQRLITFLRQSGVSPEYTEEVTTKYHATTIGRAGMGLADEELDPLFEEAVRLVVEHGKAAASLFQRRMSIGYARAARILDQLERAGVVGPQDASKPREVLISSAEQFLATRGGGA